MDGADIHDDIHWIIDRLRRSQPADFTSGGRKPRIEASLIRQLMLGFDVPGIGKVDLPGTGIRIKGAIIEGQIDLQYGCAKEGHPMPALALEACDIASPFLLTSARLQRLSLRGSRIRQLDADYVHISGLLDIRSLRAWTPVPLGNDNRETALCRVNLCGAHIEDGIEAGGAHLTAPPFDPGYRKYSGRAPYALDLPEAHVNGDVRLFPDFHAHGGVNLNGAVINGSVQAHGAHLAAVQMYALDASGAVIHGSLALDSRILSDTERAPAMLNGKAVARRFLCEGQLRLNNIVIDEDLRLHGARINTSRGRITAQHITVRGDVNMCAFDDALSEPGDEEATLTVGAPSSSLRPAIFSFECADRIDLRGAVIGGDMNFKGATLGADITHETNIGGNLDLTSSRIGGHLLFSPAIHLEKAPRDALRDKNLIQRFISGDMIKLDGTEVTGNLDFRGALLRGRLQAYGLKVHGFANLTPYVPDGSSPIFFKARGKIILDNAVIRQKLDLSGACLKDELLAPNLEVGGKLLMCAFTVRGRDDFHWFDAHERINLSGATISSDFDLTGARLHKGLRFRGGRVRSALIFDIYHAPEQPEPKLNRVSIDLINAHTNMVSDLHEEFDRNGNRYIRLGYDDGFFLRLDGFAYDRFWHRADEESLVEEEKNRRRELRADLNKALSKPPYSGREQRSPETRQRIKGEENIPHQLFKARQEWLLLQFRGRNSRGKRKVTPANYNPDAYNTLYKYYKRVGAQELADQVLFRKLSTERKTGPLVRRPLFWFVEFLWGYGLKPVQAFFVFVVFAAIVASGGWYFGASRYYTLFGAPVPQIEQNANSTKIGASCPRPPDMVTIATYTVEAIVPGFDLKAEQCAMATSDASSVRLFRLLAAIFGGIITSMTIVTWSGVLRRSLEP